jgi:hypothetical protein
MWLVYIFSADCNHLGKLTSLLGLSSTLHHAAFLISYYKLISLYHFINAYKRTGYTQNVLNICRDFQASTNTHSCSLCAVETLREC